MPGDPEFIGPVKRFEQGPDPRDPSNWHNLPDKWRLGEPKLDPGTINGPLTKEIKGQIESGRLNNPGQENIDLR